MSVTPTQIKLLLLGQSSVGKTSLVLRCATDKFSHSDTLLTIGIDITKILRTICGDTIRLELWDTAGQEKYKTLPAQYFRGIHGIILVYDITSAESFRRLQDWLQKVHQNCQLQRLSMILVGNKIDLEHCREVDVKLAEAFACDHKMKYKETSAKAGVNVDQIITEIAQEIINKGLAAKADSKKVKLESQSDRKDDCC